VDFLGQLPAPLVGVDFDDNSVNRSGAAHFVDRAELAAGARHYLGDGGCRQGSADDRFSDVRCQELARAIGHGATVRGGTVEDRRVFRRSRCRDQMRRESCRPLD